MVRDSARSAVAAAPAHHKHRRETLMQLTVGDEAAERHFTFAGQYNGIFRPSGNRQPTSSAE